MKKHLSGWLAQWKQKHLCLAGTVETETFVSVWLAQWKRACLSLLCPGFDNWRPHLRWSCGHQVRQIGFLQVLLFPPTLRPQKRKRQQRA